MADLLKELIESRAYDEAWKRLLNEAKSTTSYPRFLALCRWYKRLDTIAPRETAAKTVKVALLGGATTEMLEEPLKLSIEALGLGSQIHHAPYNLFAQEMLDSGSATAAFKPDVTVLVNTHSNIPSWPEAGESFEQVQAKVDEVCTHWLGLCARFHEHTPCEIILNNFHALPTRPLGNLGAKLPWDANNFIRRVNLTLGDRAPSYVHINDVEGLAAQYGIRQWFDSRYWYHAKQPVSFECLIPYVRNTARIIGALYGITAKCLVVDLDNTLWGGVVGDDGIHGIKIGQGDAVGEAYRAFQEYLLKLKQRGILLAVSSKNEEANALGPFQELADMVLKRDDFLVFKANWEPKPDNLRAIATELNIGTNSLVFIDDNPAEREIVRQWMPEVHVVDLTEDPADYPILLDDAGFFETVTLSNEDLQRVSQYQGNLQRQQMQSSVSDYESYLRSLEQKAVIRPFEEIHLDRITQLINKSNQFNVTTLRLSRSQVEERMRDPDMLTAYVRVADKFGDNGLISVFSARRMGDILDIEIWLMSCRVLKRGVEQLLCNYVVEQARASGIKHIRGTYIPTVKNGLVRDLFPSLGFAPLNTGQIVPSANGNGQDGTTHWTLDVEVYNPFSITIQLVEDY